MFWSSHPIHSDNQMLIESSFKDPSPGPRKNNWLGHQCLETPLPLDAAAQRSLVQIQKVIIGRAHIH